MTGWYGIARTESAANNVTDRHEQAFASLLRIDGLANDSAQEMFAYLLSGLEEELTNFQQVVNTTSMEFARFVAIDQLSEAGNEEQLNQFTVIQESWSSYVNAAEKLAVEYQREGAVNQEKFLAVEVALDFFFERLDTLNAQKAAQLQAETRTRDEIIKKSELLIGIISGVGILSLLGVSLVLLRILNTYINKIRLSDQGLQVRGAALDSISIGVCFTDAEEQEIVYVNDAFVQMTGYSRNEAIGRNCRFLQGSETDRIDLAEIRDAISAEIPVSKLLRNYRKNGEPFWNNIFISPVHDADGRTISFIGAMEDVTERVEMESKLRHTQKMDAIGKLTGGVAHDFNNLLAVILGNLELLDDRVAEPDQKELIRNGIDATLRGSELTRNMLSFARQAPLEPTIIDLNQHVRNLKNWIERTLSARVNVETSLLADLWPIEVDASSAESGLLNLILNARDALPEGGNLTIETSNVQIDEDYVEMRGEEIKPGRYVLLAVSDTGHGISSDNLKRIFEPFFTTKPVGSGSGLGLSMLEGFMRQSGGTVRVYSEPGVGTTFKLYFAATTDAKARGRLAPAQVERGNAENNTTILLVEDNVEVLETIRSTLLKTGYRVLTAVSGDAARKIFEQEPGIDLLLTDIVMPGELQGTTLAKELRTLRPDLPVIFMSGYAREATVHGNGLRPQDIRLMKPIQRKDLIRALDKALLESIG